MDKPEQRTTRRNFIGYGVVGAAAAGLIATGSVLAKRARQGDRAAGENDNELGDRFEYDLRDFARIDPKLLTYRPTDTVDTGLTDAQDMELAPDGSLWIAAKHAVTQFNAAGKPKASVELAAPAQGIAFDQRQRLYVGVADHVEVFDAQGARLATWPAVPGKPYITSLAVAGDDVFVADAGNRQVLRYDSAGELVGPIGDKSESGAGGRFVVPSPYFDVRVGPAGLLWVANTGQHRLEAYTFDGRLQRSWGKPSMAIDGFCGCCNPCHFDMLPDGRFVTSEKGLARVKVYGPDGALQGVVAGPEALGAAATGLGCAAADSSMTLPAVAADGSDRVWVLHAESGRLTTFAPINLPEQEVADGSTT